VGPSEAVDNLRKHQISFEEAKTVFLDDDALLIPDDEHSTEEERFVIMGLARGFEYWWFVIATDNPKK